MMRGPLDEPAARGERPGAFGQPALVEFRAPDLRTEPDPAVAKTQDMPARGKSRRSRCRHGIHTQPL